ncbi:hypothetical protein [Frateuria soli]|uniref:hypothetical protein n=1 Tax=Frateuria soli TaxID=1542730 RepID=UPI001E52386A|nr:hypothetical protein [Frateuria soli]UGB39019.1 hypothetical protein LQ771_04005 [Frateuria soli]
MNQLTLGQAIDQILTALEPLEESARKTALTAACMQLGISLPEVGTPSAQFSPGMTTRTGQAPDAGQDVVPTPAAAPPPQPAGRQIDIRTFREQKKPSSARQMACIVGFYLQELAPANERKETINTSDLEKYFKQAGFRLPGKINQILADAKAAGYFDVPARGEYKLNAVGYNLVAHNLPAGTD